MATKHFGQSLQLLTMMALLGLSIGDPMMTRETNSCAERKQPGLICETCELLATCVKLSSEWLTVPVESCDSELGFYCNVNLASCSNVTGPCHPFGYKGNFVCTSQGVFPDPYDCQKYHMCYVAGSTLVSANIECGGDKAFNAMTGECTLSISHQSCRSPQYQCTNVGDAAAWPNNNNLFYICKVTKNGNDRVLYPTLYRCDPTEMFDGQNCVPGSSQPSSAVPYSTSSVTPLPTGGTTSTPFGSSTPANNIQCTSIGLQPDPLDCRSYYYCSGVHGTLKHTTCPQGTYYNSALSSCAFGNC